MSLEAKAILSLAVAVAIVTGIEITRFVWVWWRARRDAIKARFAYERCNHIWGNDWTGPSFARRRQVVCRRCGVVRE